MFKIVRVRHRETGYEFKIKAINFTRWKLDIVLKPLAIEGYNQIEYIGKNEFPLASWFFRDLNEDSSADIRSHHSFHINLLKSRYKDVDFHYYQEKNQAIQQKNEVSKRNESVNDSLFNAEPAMTKSKSEVNKFKFFII